MRLIKKAIRFLMKKVVLDDINIVYDEKKIERNRLLDNSYVCIAGDIENKRKGLRHIIENNGGIVTENSTQICSKLVYLCDLESIENELDIERRWFDIEQKMKDAFFYTKKFAENCDSNHMNAKLLHIVVTKQNIEAYKIMVRGFAKYFGRKHMQTNAIFVSSWDEKTLQDTLIFLLGRQSNHINGETIEIEE